MICAICVYVYNWFEQASQIGRTHQIFWSNIKGRSKLSVTPFFSLLNIAPKTVVFVSPILVTKYVSYMFSFWTPIQNCLTRIYWDGAWKYTLFINKLLRAAIHGKIWESLFWKVFRKFGGGPTNLAKFLTAHPNTDK